MTFKDAVDSKKYVKRSVWSASFWGKATSHLDFFYSTGGRLKLELEDVLADDWEAEPEPPKFEEPHVFSTTKGDMMRLWAQSMKEAYCNITTVGNGIDIMAESKTFMLFLKKLGFD